MSISLNLTWLGQAGFRIEGDETTILIDPFISDYPGRLVPPMATPDELATADAVLVTHEHLDHFDAIALGRMPRSDTVVIVPEPLREMAIRHGIRHRVVGARPGESIEIGRAIVTPVPAFHAMHVAQGYSFGTEFCDDAHPYLGYSVDLNGSRLYHAGDSLDYPELAGSLHDLAIDVALLPINGRDSGREELDIVGNMTAEEAADLAARSGVGAVVPMHYGMFANNPGSVREFRERMHDLAPGVEVLEPRLSEPIPVQSTATDRSTT